MTGYDLFQTADISHGDQIYSKIEIIPIILRSSDTKTICYISICVTITYFT
jgi:hypothetical protein